MFKPRDRRESLFGPRPGHGGSRGSRRQRLGSRSALRPVLVGLLLLVAAWAAKERAGYYSALYEGKRATDRRDYPAAQAAIERAWRLDARHPLVLDCAGYVFVAQAAPGWKAKARDAYTRAIAQGLKSNVFINHNTEARRMLDAGAYEQAELEIEHALDLSPRNATANLLQGYLLLAQGHLGKAIEQLQKAVALAPRSTEAAAALTRAQEAKSRGSIPYFLDRHGQVLAALDTTAGTPVYPSDFLTAHIIGYRTANHGRAGLEEALGDRLRGNTVTLTLDEHLQRACDAALGWQKGAIVILKPQTGEILAAVSHPGFRPSQLDKTWARIMENPNEPLKNRALEGLYEPGSICKLISAATVIESRTDVSRLYPFKCRGYMMIGNEPFWDWKAHRTIASFSEAFNNSCNVGMARMAPLVGAATLTQFLRGFGFGEQDHITLDLPVAQSHAPLDPDTPYKLASTFIGLGQNFRITPLHAAMMIAAVANGGVMMAPQLVKEVRSVTGAVIASGTPRIFKIAVRKETASALTEHLIDFVQNGIGKKARMVRYHVAGKTGTSGSAKRGLHGWFICFAPAEKPELAMAILCENGGTGQFVAAPIAQRVLSDALH